MIHLLQGLNLRETRWNAVDHWPPHQITAFHMVSVRQSSLKKSNDGETTGLSLKDIDSKQQNTKKSK